VIISYLGVMEAIDRTGGSVTNDFLNVFDLRCNMMTKELTSEE